MNIRFPAIVAASFALSQLAIPLAQAQTPAAEFRTVEPQTFNAADLQTYGLSTDDTAAILAYQQQGYTVQLVTPEEAAAYDAGMTNSNILALVGLVVIVLVVASAI